MSKYLIEVLLPLVLINLTLKDMRFEPSIHWKQAHWCKT
jgi:hypothetical protein